MSPNIAFRIPAPLMERPIDCTSIGITDGSDVECRSFIKWRKVKLSRFFLLLLSSSVSTLL